MKDRWTDEELIEIEVLTDDLIVWMFHKPNDRYPLEKIIKKAIIFGKEKKK